MTTCDKCGSLLADPTGLDLLAFQLRNAYWKHDSIKDLPILAWQLLDSEEQEKWRRVALAAGDLQIRKLNVTTE